MRYICFIINIDISRKCVLDRTLSTCNIIIDACAVLNGPLTLVMSGWMSSETESISLIVLSMPIGQL